MEDASITKITDTPSACGNLQNHIYMQIRSGKLKPGEKLHTAGLAKEWRVSEGTVHQSLRMLAAKGVLVRKRHAGTFVGNNSQSQVEECRQKSSSILLLTPDLSKPEFLILAQAIQANSVNTRFSSTAIGTDNNIDRYCQIIHESIEQGIAGLIIVPPLYGSIPIETLIDLYKSKMPVVCCHRAIPGFGWPLVRVDVVYNVEIAVRHLLELGKRHVGFVGMEPLSKQYGLLKEHAFMATVHEFGFSTHKGSSIVLPLVDPRTSQGLWLVSAMNQIEQWLEDNPKIDGICCVNDISAWATTSALAKRGKKIPDDIAVVGNGDLMRFFGFNQSDLTTIDVSYNGMVTAIFQLLTKMRNGEQVENGLDVEIKGKLIIRHSNIGDTDYSKQGG
ncbi:MAG: hypothetical protein A2Y07_06965 [Planctomycetes bacterium GWF2_50_10]|nr:MAG: hypothetical protein A2Y07_06965 [Planctomycetes bacterium GWF2_50_10]